MDSIDQSIAKAMAAIEAEDAEDEIEAGLILLARIEAARTPGSMPVKADCGCDCWISKSALEFHLNPDRPTKTSCVPCSGIAVEDMPLLGLSGQIGAIPGAYAELEKLLGADVADSIRRALSIEEHKP